MKSFAVDSNGVSSVTSFTKFFLLLIGFVSVTAFSQPKKLGKLIIDVDAGGDDAGAILLILAAERQLNRDGLEVMAITSTYGNTNVSNVGNNVLKVLTIARRSDIPVYVGAHQPLIKKNSQDLHYGHDGFGDFKFDEKIEAKINRSIPASLAMVEYARRYPGKLSIMALGPLTNIALAISLDPNFINNVAKFYIMGSCVHGLGNIAPNAEYNFYQDPHSNYIVLSNIRKVASLFPWETTMNANISLTWRKDIFGKVNSRSMMYLNKIEKKSWKGDVWKVADIMLAALSLWPELVTRTIVTYVLPVTDGAAQGSVLVDYRDRLKKPANVEILDSFNVDRFKEVLIDYFSRD